MTSEARATEPDQLEVEYLARKAAIRANKTLSWEKKELQVKQLGDEFCRAQREMEAV